MELRDLHEHSFALLLMGTTVDGQDDWVVFAGTARVDGSGLRVDRGRDEAPFRVASEFMPRIRLTSPEQREILLGAEFVLPLTVGALAEDVDPNEYLATGLKWPD